ncbi:MAG: hypothetical protein QGH60_18575, partial [Phycisphaerae bacterium]|nr:hypothetical protein [Phycisphaerae bacterium]
ERGAICDTPPKRFFVQRKYQSHNACGGTPLQGFGAREKLSVSTNKISENLCAYNEHESVSIAYTTKPLARPVVDPERSRRAVSPVNQM